jgi:hypothetical protein
MWGHILHNSCNAACESFCKGVEKFCLHIHEYFESSSKWEAFVLDHNVEVNFVKHFKIKWTTIGPASERIISMFTQLTAYFAKIINCQGKGSIEARN